MDDTESERPTPDASLQMHLFQMASQAAMALGEVENPITKKREVDLTAARYLIDTLVMLGEKTRGNRTEDEDRYLDGVLTELRLKYVEKSKTD